MKKLFLLCFFVVFSVYSIEYSSLRWNSWKVLVPTTLFIGIAGCTFGLVKFNNFNKKAGIAITSFQELKLAFTIYLGMQLGKLNLMSDKKWGCIIHYAPILKDDGDYRSAIAYGMIAARKANPETLYKDTYNSIIKQRKDFKKEWGD